MCYDIEQIRTACFNQLIKAHFALDEIAHVPLDSTFVELMRDKLRAESEDYCQANWEDSLELAELELAMHDHFGYVIDPENVLNARTVGEALKRVIAI